MYNATPVVEADIIEPISDATKTKLKEILKGVEILGLGENTHEDGATFKAKIKLIKFLHEEMNYNVLAFESSFFGCWSANKAFKEGEIENIYDVAKNCSGWTMSNLAFPIFEYIAETHKTDNPLFLAGFDGEKLPMSKSNMKTLFERIKNITDMTLTEEMEVSVDSLIRGSFNGFNGVKTHQAMSNTSKNNVKKMLDSLSGLMISKKEAIEEEIGSNDYNLYKLFLESMIEEGKLTELLFTNMLAWNVSRDRLMGERVSWLKEIIYPNEKIILWAASGHLMRNNISIERKSFESQPYYQAGDYIYNDYKDKYYNLVFTSAKGNNGVAYTDIHPWKECESIKPISKYINQDSFEDLASRLPYDEFIVDLGSANNSWLSDSYSAHPF